MCTHFVAVYGVLMRIFFQLRYAKKKSFPSNAWLCSCSRKITRNDYQTLSSLYINETMKQCWSLSSQCVIVSQIDYLPQPLASQISVPSDQIYWCFAYSLLTSDKIHQSLCSKTPTNVDTPSCVVFFWRNLCLCLKCGEPTIVSVTSRFKAKLWFSKFLSTISSVACSAGVLWGRVNFRELVIVYSAGHVWFGVRVDGEGKGAWKGPLSSFLTVAHFLVLIWYFFLSPAFHCLSIAVKI